MELQAHQQRVVEEKNALEEKVYKLSHFFISTTYGNLDNEDKDLLQEQHTIMELYLKVLNKRIERFKTN